MARYNGIKASSKGTRLVGCILKPSDSVVIRYVGGLWSCNPAVIPDHDANGSPNYRAKAGYLYPGANEGRLIACVGEPAVKKEPVGNYGVITGVAGQLWVACNDDWNGRYGIGYGDNAGTIDIEVYSVKEFLQTRSDEEIKELLEAHHNQSSLGLLAYLRSLSDSQFLHGVPDRDAPIPAKEFVPVEQLKPV